MNKINIFILAAGIGERLRPVTSHIPKPLIPVLGKPAIQRVLDNVSDLPFNRIGINLHYRKEEIEEWVRRCSLHQKIVLFPEEHILGTGGALKNAGEFLKEGTFLVHNADILSDINLISVLQHHRSSRNFVTLAVHDYEKFNSVIVDEHGFFVGVKGGLSGRMLAFTGIAVYESGFLDYLPDGKSSVVDAWSRATAEGKKIGTYDVSGCCWSDIGSPDAYAAAVFEMLRREGEVVYIHPSVDGCAETDIKGYAVLEKGCGLDKGVSLRNCILFSGSILSNRGGGQRKGAFENCIMGPGFKIDLTQSVILSIDENNRQLIGTGGSDRRYYRIQRDDTSVVLMQCKNDDPDFERQIEYARYFLTHAVPVPALIEADIEKKNALFEDAGDISLYSWLKCPRDRIAIENIYKQVIDIMVLIHTDVTEDISGCPLLESRIFDYDHFLWETHYFMKRFVEGVRNINITKFSSLNEELHQLAAKADSFPKAVIHRDFQSQNIMVMTGQKLRLIDYQGARLGPPAYDVVSLLWDPYYRLKDEMRVCLLDYYIDQMKARYSAKFDEDIFKSSLVLYRLQRHMQALGAYGFLSLVKGKKYFQKYMPEGLRLLKDDVSYVKDDSPELYELIIGL